MDTHPFTVLSLCAGAGGLDLGIRLAVPDARLIVAVEIEAYACALLEARMREGILDDAAIWTDIKSFDGRPWRGMVDCIIAGYPCQPFSVAGKRLGDKDPRHLWPEVARIVDEIQPPICFFENVGGHLRLGFEQVHNDLQRMGYTITAGLFTAAEVGSTHKRERLFILAYRNSDRCHDRESTPTGKDDPQRREECATHPIPGRDGDAAAGFSQHRTGFTETTTGATLQNQTDILADTSCQRERKYECGVREESNPYLLAMDDTNSTGLEGWSSSELCSIQSRLPWPPGPSDDEGWQNIPDGLKPAILRMADGMAYRVDRIRAIGNGVCPLAAAYAFLTLTAHASK